MIPVILIIFLLFILFLSLIIFSAFEKIEELEKKLKDKEITHEKRECSHYYATYEMGTKKCIFCRKLKPIQ
jgi:thioredoxin-related protein